MIVINQFKSGGGVADRSFPIGAIVLWYGIESNIPSGYILCNGLNSTPDIRGRFIRGASSGTELLSTSGSATHLHSGGGVSFAGGHSHSIGVFSSSAESNYNTGQSGGGATAASYGHNHSSSGATTSTGGSHTHSQSGTSSISSSMPPYKSLYWIKRIA